MQGGPGDRGRTSEPRYRAKAPDATEDFLFHLYRGSELLQDNRVHEAKEELEQALKLQPRDAKGQDLLAVVYFRLGLYPRAIEIYEELTVHFRGDASLAQNLS
ncbi:MAG TPA: tetratricopeptide repeat protein, partial [Polyangiaceae bacterium]|nr:tetratricopeptide repeat protein [Polyangiaceae bacterium]